MRRLRRRLSADTDAINVDGGSSVEGYLSLAISVPDGYHFSKEACSKFDVETEPANAIEIEPVKGFLNSRRAGITQVQKDIIIIIIIGKDQLQGLLLQRR